MTYFSHGYSHQLFPGGKNFMIKKQLFQKNQGHVTKGEKEISTQKLITVLSVLLFSLFFSALLFSCAGTSMVNNDQSADSNNIDDSEIVKKIDLNELLENTKWNKAEAYCSSLEGEEQAEAYIKLAAAYGKIPEDSSLNYRGSNLTPESLYFLNDDNSILAWYNSNIAFGNLETRKLGKSLFGDFSFKPFFAIDDEENYLASFYVAKKISLWDLKTETELWFADDYPWNITMDLAVFDTKNNQVIVGGTDRQKGILIVKHDILTGNILLSKIVAPGEDIQTIALSGDSSYFIVGDKNKNITICDTVTAEPLLNKKFSSDVNDIKISKDGKMIYIASKNLISIYEYNALEKNLKLKIQFSRHSKPITSLVLSNDGKTLFSADYNGTIYIWDLETYSEKRKIQLDDMLLMKIAVNKSNTYLALQRYYNHGYDVFIFSLINKEQKIKECYQKIADAYLSAEKYGPALEYYKIINPDSDMGSKLFNDFISEKDFFRAEIVYLYIQSSSERDEILAEGFESIGVEKSAVRFYKSAGKVRFIWKEYKKSAENYEKAGDSEGMAAAAEKLLENGDFETGVEYFIKSGYPENEAYLKAAEISLETKKYDIAAEYYEKLGDLDGFLKVAEGYLANNEFDKAAEYYEKAGSDNGSEIIDEAKKQDQLDSAKDQIVQYVYDNYKRLEQGKDLNFFDSTISIIEKEIGKSNTTIAITNAILLATDKVKTYYSVADYGMVSKYSFISDFLQVILEAR